MVTADDLFQAQEKRLQLEWLAGKSGGTTLLEPATAKYPGMALVGHLNFVHPNRVQILGVTEVQYLNALDDKRKTEMIEELFECPTTALIVIASNLRPDYLITRAEQAGVPLLSSPLPSPVVIEHLQYYLARALAPRLTVHGVYMEVLGMGVFITGESGIGKSELALELLSRNHRLIADDVAEFIQVGPDVLVGQCPEMLSDYMEVRGLGIINVRTMFGEIAVRHKKKLHLIVNLKKLKGDETANVDRLQTKEHNRKMLSAEIPEVILYVAPGRNLAVLVEAATQAYILRTRGIDPLNEFINRHQELIKKNSQ
ncbi:MAG: HPr kinase/phosphorylase [Proteobacteria bacterium]|nr:HPr kinase/phosphorylase [Pseudomonadota bacterium]